MALAMVTASVLALTGAVAISASPAQAVTTESERCGPSDSPTFSGGSGTSSDPYLISSYGNLQTLDACVSRSSSEYNQASVFYKQTANIDMGGNTFEIGHQAASAHPFKANYDGDGFAVYDFSSPYGLFAEGLGGAASGCVIEDLVVSGSATSTTASAAIGVVLGESNGCTLDGVTAFGTVTRGSSWQAVGGLVGRGQSVNRASLITNSTSHVDVSTEVSQVDAGGLVGTLTGGTLSNSSATRMADPWDSDTLRGQIVTSVDRARVGGAAGYISDTTVSNVFSTIEITGTNFSCSTCLALGGLIGEAQSSTSPVTGSITNSYSTGDMTFPRLGANKVGGLVGILDIPLTSSYSTSSISLGIENSNVAVGGLVGQNDADGDISESYYSGTITTTNDASTAASRIGGLVGWAEGDISESYAVATISGLDSSDAGGLVGRQESTSTVADSFAAGSISAESGSDSEVAGLVLQTYSGTISRAYSFVDVSGFGSAGYPVTDYSSSGSYTAVYWNEDASGGLTSSDYGSELSNSAFTDSSNFSGWNFSSTWTMGTCAPYLTWIGSSPSGLCPATVPSAPTIDTVTAGDGQLAVAFTAGSDGGAAISDYEYSTDSGSNWTSVGQTTSPFTITGLTNGQSYSVTLRAVNSEGESTASNAVSGTPVAPTPSPTPSSDPDSDDTTPAATPTPLPTTPALPPRPASPPDTDEPERETGSAVPATPPGPSGPADPDTAPAAPASPGQAPGPGTTVLSVDEVMSGQIVVPSGTENVTMPAVLLRDIATELAPAGAPMDDGVLLIETGQNLVPVLMVSLGDVTLRAADLGTVILFTLNIPGFESNSMSVAVDRQVVTWMFWVQVVLLVIMAAALIALFFWFIGSRRRRQRDKPSVTRVPSNSFARPQAILHGGL